MRARVHGLLLLYALALAAAAGVAVLALGLPLAARGALGPPALAVLAGAATVAVLALAVALLSRGVGAPVERLLQAASRLGGGGGPGEGLPILGEPGGFALSRAAVAFERLAAALAEERSRLAAKVEELTATNRALAEARESLLRTEKLATVGRLAAGLAHEVGNPLGAVSGYVELARARLPPDPHPDLLDALARIDAAAGRIDRIVRDLLDFARPAPPLLAPLALAPAVDAALRLARVQSRFKLVEVEVDLPPDLPPVLADEGHLGQVLLNLLLNAGDAMRGEGRVRIAAASEEGGVALTVADGGPGIAPGDLPHVFDPFFTTKDPGEGTGLGLALSHRIMESFGGEIVAGNAPAGGAVLALRFRVAGQAAP
ncbi:MAG TPA: ATP-binding protein [Anaeromyxobacteraceae bacterium]